MKPNIASIIAGIVIAGITFLSGNPAIAFELVHENDDPAKVVNTLSLDDSPWRSKVMLCPDKFLPARDREWSGNDFFMDEFGIPCDFAHAKISAIRKFMRFSPTGKHEFSNGTLVITGGKKGTWFAFGPEPNTHELPSLRFGCTWGRHRKDRYRIRMVISQDVAESEWEFSTFGFQGRYKNIKKFKVKGKDEQTFEADAGIVRNLLDNHSRRGMCGFRLDCKTPNATVRIRSIKVAPYTGNAYFRKTFTLPERPVMAHATYDAPETYELFVNGHRVDQGTDIYTRGSVKTIDLKPYLQKGKNTIAVRKEFFTWLGGRPEFIFEGIAITRAGNITRILCPQGWKSSIKHQQGWMRPDFDDSTWKQPVPYTRGLHQVITSWGSNGKTFWTGVEPRHMGMLQAKPLGRKYPVWDYAEEARFAATIPAGAADRFTPRLRIYRAQTRELAKTVSPPPPKTNPESGLAEYVFSIRELAAGPYRLEWELCDRDGKVREMNRQELIMAGPIRQEEFGLAEFEAELEKRLKRVIAIDCTRPVEVGEEFCGHTGNISAPKVNKGIVISADNMKYRETGKSPRDWYAYRLHGLELGKPYLAEVIVPDNRDRYIYAGIIEQWPLGFECNFASGDWPNHTATGACITGVDQPLSMQTRKIRFVFWPGSRCAAIFVMSGFRAFPAAACAINIYAVEGDLPALKIPASPRMFGSHNERISVMTLTTGISENPLMQATNRCKNGLRDGWLNWYRAIERKIKWLRFQGRNMTVEGVYMYWRGDYPSLKHNTAISNQELDPPLLAIKLYNRNNIKCLLGVEYQSSPQVWARKPNHTSDRKMWETGAGIHQVDKYGRQVVGGNGSGVNFLNPNGAKYMLDCISEIYDFYRDAGRVEGLFMVAGGWWQPAFTTASLTDIGCTDVGYGDYTVGLFEQETGVKLGIDPKAPDRFMKRYERLMGEHKALWLYWRARKTREFFSKISRLVSSGGNRWPLYIMPSLRIQDNPFLEPNSTRKQRDQYLDRCYTESGLPLEMFENDPAVKLVGLAKAWGKFMSPYENWMYCKGMTNNRGSRRLLQKLDSVYFHLHKGLDEVDQPAGAAAKWIWSRTGRGVFLPRWAGENAMAEYVNVLSWEIPRILFYGWLDCNMDTGTGKEVRRFARSFLVTPEAEFRALPPAKVKGIIAQTAAHKGKTYLRLVNNTPWRASGSVRITAGMLRDLVYERDIAARNHECAVSMKPYDIRIFELTAANAQVACRFNLPEKIEADLFARAKFVLDDPVALESIPGDIIALMFKALAAKDAAALRRLMDDFEAKAAIAQAERSRSALRNQAKLLADLDQGRARIICASETGYRALDGSYWLPDQAFTDCGAYGNEGATFADRGDLDIKDTNLDRVYQTEAYGARVFYRIPVPKGKYNVYLHFAETYIGIKLPNMRRISVKVESVLYPTRIDPFALVGWGKPYVLAMKSIPAYDGTLDIELTGGVCINGIEIERCK